MADVTMPQLGETVTEGTITQWFKNVGDAVAMDEILFEVSTDKVDSEVPSPVAGVVTEILAGEGDVVEVGQVLCRVGDVDAHRRRSPKPLPRLSLPRFPNPKRPRRPSLRPLRQPPRSLSPPRLLIRSTRPPRLPRTVSSCHRSSGD